MDRLQQVLRGENENYMLPFFWQHGEDEGTLREYMRAIYNANIRAVCVESRPHPDFAKDKWWEDMDVILDEAKKLGMKVWILDDSHFPTGYANGAVKSAPKNLRHQYMCCRTLEMAGPVQNAEFELERYMKPAPLPPWIPAPPKEDDDYEDDWLVRILACPVLEGEKLGTPLDLTDRIQDKNVVFDLPAGYYKIYVVYLTRNARGRNDYINFLDRESCRILIDAVYEPHYAHYAQYFGSVIAGFFSDEPPIGNVEGYTPIGPIGTAGQNLPWSDAAAERLTEEYGDSSWQEILPYLWADAEDHEQQARVRSAYMNMVTGLVEECFSRQLGEWCFAHGVEYIGHMLEDCDMNMSMGASMGHFFRGLAGQHMAGVDNIGGQVTIHGQDAPRHERPACQDEAGFYHYMLGKLGASHAALDPKKKGRCLCENFGAYGWQSGPKEEKFMLDHFMVRGVNHFVPHAFSPAPFPDRDCPPHFYAHGENPTYRAFGELMAYGNRVCHLLNGGTPCPDVALLYAAEGVWAGGGLSDIPACRSLSQAQIDFHILPADVLGENDEYPFVFDGGGLKVNGVKYAALVIPGCDYLAKKAADFVIQAVKEHFPIVFTDKKPVGVIGAESTENEAFCGQIEACPLIASEHVGCYIREQCLLLPQTECMPARKMLTSYHYQLEGYDVYFLLNEMEEETYQGTVRVQAQGIAVRYDPWHNCLREVIAADMPDGRKRLELSIDPLELCVIVFLKDVDEWNVIDTWSPIAKEEEKTWDKAFAIKEMTVGKVNAAEYLKQLRLAGVGLHEGKAVVKAEECRTVYAPFAGMQKEEPDYSGYYIYETTAALQPGRQYRIDIDRICETVEVFVNGRSLGTLVQAPYRFEIPADLVQPETRIRIETATLLERRVRAMGENFASMSAERPMSPTGIVGNVTIMELQK